MSSILSIFQSPVFIGILLFLGIASLARLLLARDRTLKRHYRGDRRGNDGIMPSKPFQDSDGIEVTQDRRAQDDRRRHRAIFD